MCAELARNTPHGLLGWVRRLGHRSGHWLGCHSQGCVGRAPTARSPRSRAAGRRPIRRRQPPWLPAPSKGRPRRAGILTRAATRLADRGVSARCDGRGEGPSKASSAAASPLGASCEGSPPLAYATALACSSWARSSVTGSRERNPLDCDDAPHGCDDTSSVWEHPQGCGKLPHAGLDRCIASAASKSCEREPS
eukprot:scaffold50558_cov30-Tisochrysis_lutea.AAC.6